MITIAARIPQIHHLLAGKNGEHLFMIALAVAVLLAVSYLKTPGG